MENRPDDSNWTVQPERPRHHHRSNAWWALILIFAGAILLLQNLHVASFSFNWWALFIFLPVLGSLSSAWDSLREDGRFTARVSGSLGSAVLVGTVATLLLFGMDWTRWWPIVVIAGGLSFFLAGLGRFSGANQHTFSAFAHLGLWVGLSGMVWGAGFLATTLPVLAWQPYLIIRWWAIPILIVGVGALINAFGLFWQTRHGANWAAWSMLVVAICVSVVGLLAYFALDWNLLFPVILIVCGLAILVEVFARRG